MSTLRFDVFGRDVLLVRSASGWDAFLMGPEGKRRPAREIFVPSSIAETQLEQYLGDLCHEWASERHPVVKRRTQGVRSEDQ